MSKMNCPVCGSELQDSTYHGWVRDGNSVYGKGVYIMLNGNDVALAMFDIHYTIV